MSALNNTFEVSLDVCVDNGNLHGLSNFKILTNHRAKIQSINVNKSLLFVFRALSAVSKTEMLRLILFTAQGVSIMMKAY